MLRANGKRLRVAAAAALLMGASACSSGLLQAPPGHLTLSNYRFNIATVQAVTTAADCGTIDPAAVPPMAFELPYKGTRVVEAAPAADICWRRQIAEGPDAGKWTAWNRVFTANGRFIDVQL